LNRRKRVARKAGQEVTIYYDPFRNKQVEGQAHLIKLVEKNKETDVWWVLFDDGHRCKRRIKHEYE